MKIFKHNLGLKAVCKITGFEGVITSRVEFLTGCNRYALQPTELVDGKIVESVYFDEDQINIIGEALDKNDFRGEKRGACAPNPTK